MKTSRPPRGPRSDEQDSSTVRERKYYGVNACLELWQQRPEDVIRVYLIERRLAEFSELLKWCAAKKKAYHIVPPEEISKVSQTNHHEGICILAKAKEAESFEDDILPDLLRTAPPQTLLFLDGVENPHNLGSIMRVAAHFDVSCIFGEKDKLPSLSGAAARVSAGASEKIRLAESAAPLASLRRLKDEGFTLIATSSHKGTAIFDHRFSEKTVLLIGAEGAGLAPEVIKLANTTLTIPGTGEVESLNVATATAVMLAERWRQLRAASKD